MAKRDQIAVPVSSRMAAVRVVNVCFFKGTPWRILCSLSLSSVRAGETGRCVCVCVCLCKENIPCHARKGTPTDCSPYFAGEYLSFSCYRTVGTVSWNGWYGPFLCCREARLFADVEEFGVRLRSWKVCKKLDWRECGEKQERRCFRVWVCVVCIVCVCVCPVSLSFLLSM